MCPLTQPRVGIKSSLSEAVWCPDTESVIITRNTGKQELGPLSPEEALQLLENNSLYLTRSGVPMSIQAAYTLLLSPVTGVTPSMYLVYSRLSRAGFRVLTHQGKIEQPVMNEKDDNIVDNDEDIDKSQLTPLYGVPLLTHHPGYRIPRHLINSVILIRNSHWMVCTAGSGSSWMTWWRRHCIAVRR